MIKIIGSSYFSSEMQKSGKKNVKQIEINHFFETKYRWYFSWLYCIYCWDQQWHSLRILFVANWFCLKVCILFWNYPSYMFSTFFFHQTFNILIIIILNSLFVFGKDENIRLSSFLMHTCVCKLIHSHSNVFQQYIKITD